MGNGIAHVMAQKGFKVNLIDAQSAAIDKALVTIAKNLDRQIAKGIITEVEKISTLQNIQCFTEIELGVKEADLFNRSIGFSYPKTKQGDWHAFYEPSASDETCRNYQWRGHRS